MSNSEEQTEGGSKWYPTHVSELDNCNLLLEASAGQPDDAYNARKKEIVKLAKEFRYGDVIQKVEYTEEETATWKTLYTELKKLHPTKACKEYLKHFKELEEVGMYSPDEIPQLEDVSRFLKAKTGFELRPVGGLLSSRDFLSSLAFRTFQSIQFVRRASNALFSPEPDCCHELLGHVPMLCDPKFALFSQQLGLASLGASKAYIQKLIKVYWYTLEVGLCEQDGSTVAFGAAVLSSAGEIKNAFSEVPKLLSFDPADAAKRKFPITKYQPVYYVTKSLDLLYETVQDYIQRELQPKHRFSVSEDYKTVCLL